MPLQFSSTWLTLTLTPRFILSQLESHLHRINQLVSLQLPIKDHSNYIGIDENAGHFAVSMLREDTRVRLILWLPSGVQVAVLDVPLGETIQVTDAMKRLGWNYSKKKLKEMKKGESFEPGVPLVSGVSMASPSGSGSSSSSSYPVGKWEMELVKLESRVAQRFGTYKFGVLYVKEGQTTEEEMFSNRVSSPAFKDFCTMLGDKIELREWPFFSGGLDTKSDRTGRLSVYTQHCGYEIMFHVSTMLPYNHSDTQQIDRKRHIGNDVVIVVFVDEDVSDSWSPTVIAARFPHIYAIVKPFTNPVDGSTSWLLNVASKDTVSTFGPPLPQPPLFTDPAAFRLFLLSKLINGEREAIRAVPDFRQNNAHLSDLQELYDKVSKDLKNSDTGSTGTAKESLKSGSSLASTVSFADSNESGSTASGLEADSILNLMASPRAPGGHLLGRSSPSLFGVHSSSGAHPTAAFPSVSRDPPFGGSFNLPPGASSRDLRSTLHQSSAALTRPSNSPPVSVPALVTTTQEMVRRSIQSQLPHTMFATTETVQAFQNRPFYQNFPTEITCACDAWDGLTMVGTVDGLFVLDQNQYGAVKVHETKTLTHKHQVHRSNHYLQLTVIEELNILLALISKVGVVMYDLSSILNFPQTSLAREMLLPKTKDATLFSLGSYQDELALATSVPRGIVIHRWQDDIFKPSQLISGSQPLVMEFDSRGYILAASESEFFWLKPDPENPTSNSIMSWSEKDRGMDPIAALLFENTGEYLLCFESVGYFVNLVGQKTRNFDFRWYARPVSVVSVYPYLLVFSKQHLEIRYLSNGSLCQFFELDPKLESHLKFMSAFNGIQIATVSHLNVGLTSGLGSSTSLAKKDAQQDLTSSSGSSTAPGTPTLPSSSSTAVRSPSPSSSSSNLREGSSLTTNSSTQTSTIHILRLNTVNTGLVSNPQQLLQSTSGNPSFTVQGLQLVSLPPVAVPQLSPTPPLTIPPNMHSLSLNSARRPNTARKSGSGSNATPNSANANDFSAGSSPHSPASVLQQHFNANEGTASVDDSDDVFRGGSGSATSATIMPDVPDPTPAIPFRRKSPGREAKSSMQIGSVGSSGSERSLPPLLTERAGSFGVGSGQLPNMRFKSSAEDVAGGAGSKSSSPIRRSDDPGSPSPTARLSASAKISRRKSLAFESDLSPAGMRRRREGSAGATPPNTGANALIISHPHNINLTTVSGTSLGNPSARSASASSLQTVQLPHLQIHASVTAAHYQTLAKRHSAMRQMELAAQFDYDPSFEAQEDEVFDDDEMMALPSPLPRSSLKQVRGAKGEDSDDGQDEDEDDDEDSSNTASPGTARSNPTTANDSPTARPRKKSARTASDKLSGSSERSPRSSPAAGSGRFRSTEGNGSSESPSVKKARKLRQGSGSSSSSGTTRHQHVRSGSDMLAAPTLTVQAVLSPRAPVQSSSRGGAGDDFSGFGGGPIAAGSLAALALAAYGSTGSDATSGDMGASGSTRQKMMNKRNRKSLGGALTGADLMAEGVIVDPQHFRGLSPGRGDSPSRERTSPSRRASSARKVPSRTSSATPSEVGTPTSDSSLPEMMSNLAKFTLEGGRSASPAKIGSPKSRRDSSKRSVAMESESGSGSAPASPVGTPTKRKSQKTPDKLRIISSSPAPSYAAPSTVETPLSLIIDPAAINLAEAMATSSESPISPRKIGLASSSQAILSPRSSAKKDKRKSEKKTSDSPLLVRKAPRE